MAWMTLAEAVAYAGRDRLQEALLAGDIPARARYANGTAMPISDHWWNGPVDWDAGLIAYKGFNPGAPDYPPGLREHPLYWLPVEVERGALLEACPSGAGSLRGTPEGVPQWYRDWIETNKAADTPTSRAQDVAASREKYGDAVPEQLIRDLRKVLAPEEWQEPGRPRKK